MRAASALDFGLLARRLADEARRHGLVAPSFRSPPRVAAADRSIRRVPGGAIVAVRVTGRPWAEVAADMVEGVLATNRLRGQAAAGWRVALGLLVAPVVDDLDDADGPDGGPGVDATRTAA